MNSFGLLNDKMQLSSVTIAIITIIICAETKLAPTVKLNNGYNIPIIGLGTFETKPGDAERAVKDAIDIGYRHIDTAYLYGNEVAVGNAIRAKIDEGIIKREDIFVTTKLWSTFHEPDQAVKAFIRSFKNLNLGYIDLYLMHYPGAYRRVLKNLRLPSDDVDSFKVFPINKNGRNQWVDIDYVETWKTMEKFVKDGRVRSIGISNFNSSQTDRILSIATIKPVINQIECHPNLNQRKLIDFCAARNIKITAYSPLGRPHTLSAKKLAISDPKVLKLAQKYQKSPAQIILRYTVQNGAIIIPKSTNKNHIRDNFNIFNFELSKIDMTILHELNNNYRLINFPTDTDNKYYPFHLEF